MATKQMNISLPPELKASIDDRVKSGQYGNASDVIRAGLRALTREEMAVSVQEFERILGDLPHDLPPAGIEDKIADDIRRDRARERRKPAKSR